MGVFNITGTIASIGQSEFNNRGTLYAFVEIIEPSGRRVLVQNVAVGNQVLPAINLGCKGEFFFDKLFVPGKPLISQMWGVKTPDGLVAFDHNMRKPQMILNLLVGILAAPILGLGIPFLILGLFQAVQLIVTTGTRQQMFYGNDRMEAQRLRQQQAVRI
ncbi:MAG: hypothetical protein HYX37_14710 [Rhizobiales bacterium]|nr:hypothetical protein [Hyphomicrobiales bacterium]